MQKQTIKVVGSNPFTPKSGMEPKVFLGREKELEVFYNQLERAKNGYFNHFIILGDWGVGKTTLLKEYKKITQSQGLLTSFVAIREYTERELLSPTVQLITHIPRNLPVKFEKMKKFGQFLNGLGITLPIIGGGIQFKDKERFKGDPQLLLLDALLKLWDELKNEVKIILVLLDDVHNYQHIPEFLTLLKNVLSDEEVIKQTGFLFVLSSTYKGWLQFMEKNHPIGRYFIPIVRLRNLEKEKVWEILDRTLDGTGVSFGDDVKKMVFEYTEGHPFQLQVLCEYLYENQVEGKVRTDSFESALNRTLEDLGDIMLDYLYNLASEKEKEVLKVMAKFYEVTDHNRLLKQCISRNIISNKSPFSALLNRLVKKDLILKTERGNYKLPNRIFAEYILRRS